MILDQRAIINEIFLPLPDSPWGLIPRSVLNDFGLHRNTLLFFSEKYDSLVHLLTRREPSEDTFVGNFPCSTNVLDWMQNNIRKPGDTNRDRGVKEAYVATIENARTNEVIAFAQVCEVVLRTAKLEPHIAQKSKAEFFWLDQDLFPAKIYSKRRAFREVNHLLPFMRKPAEQTEAA
jgi:hypothetical protein